MEIKRRKTRTVHIGGVPIGSEHPIAIQSMCNTKTENVEETVKQIKELEAAGCEIVRVTIPKKEAALAIKDIKKEINIPLVGDIHFDYRMALLAIENGIDKIRINPGNIGGEERTREVIEAARERNVPMRIGVNSGSLEKDILQKYGKVTPDGIVESMLRNIGIFEKADYHNIILSLKASDVGFMIDSYRKIAPLCDYPLHLGVTESGGYRTGSIKSSVGLGILLAEGLGDTIRVSLTGDVVQEIFVAKEILKSLGIRQGGVNIISCPTCGRTEVNLEKILHKVEEGLLGLTTTKNIDVAVMGCAVNGPGESREADIGIACGRSEALLFIKGETVRKVKEDEAADVLISEVKKLYAE